MPSPNVLSLGDRVHTTHGQGWVSALEKPKGTATVVLYHMFALSGDSQGVAMRFAGVRKHGR